MKILEVKKVEDCFDGSTIYGYSFDEKWTRETIFQLKAMGELDYFPDFPRPFFRVRGKDGLQIKGVEGEDNCRAIYPQKQKEVRKQEFENLFRA